MQLSELSPIEYYNYVSLQPNCSFYQTLEYATFMKENGYSYELIGIKDSLNNVRAAGLIVFNKIDDKNTYGYAPRGFVIDYNDKNLIRDFSEALKKYYKKRNIVFIKINPDIVISKYNNNKKEFIDNDNIEIINTFQNNNYQKLKRTKYFESLLPSYSPIIDLSKYDYNNLDKNVRNKISKCYRKGLFIEKRDIDSIRLLYPFIKNKSKKTIDYYESLLREFSKSNSVDLFLIRVNFEEFLINSKDKYEKELVKNNKLTKKLINHQTEKLINRKMQSDRELLTYKNDIRIATEGLSRNKNEIVGGAIIIKYKNKVSIYESGYNIKYKELNINDFLYYKLIEYYKYNYNYLDLNGFSGDLSSNNPYQGLNNFKMGFNPKIYEYIGEYDIVLKKHLYKKMASNGTLSNIFK